MTNATKARDETEVQDTPADSPPVLMVTRVGRMVKGVKESDEQVAACPHGKDPEACDDGVCKFRRVAIPRTLAAIEKIRLIGNASGRGYTYTEAQANAIVTRLRAEVQSLDDALAHRNTAADEFSL